MYELQSCEVCRWWCPDPGTDPPVPREGKAQPGECRIRSAVKIRRSDQWCDRWAQKIIKKEQERK